MNHLISFHSRFQWLRNHSRVRWQESRVWFILKWKAQREKEDGIPPSLPPSTCYRGANQRKPTRPNMDFKLVLLGLFWLKLALDLGSSTLQNRSHQLGLYRVEKMAHWVKLGVQLFQTLWVWLIPQPHPPSLLLVNREGKWPLCPRVLKFLFVSLQFMWVSHFLIQIISLGHAFCISAFSHLSPLFDIYLRFIFKLTCMPRHLRTFLDHSTILADFFFFFSCTSYVDLCIIIQTTLPHAFYR